MNERRDGDEGGPGCHRKELGWRGAALDAQDVLPKSAPRRAYSTLHFQARVPSVDLRYRLGEFGCLCLVDYVVSTTSRKHLMRVCFRFCSCGYVCVLSPAAYWDVKSRLFV